MTKINDVMKLHAGGPGSGRHPMDGHSIVRDKKHLYRMGNSDFRHPKIDPKWGYTLVTYGETLPGKHRDPENGYMTRHFQGQNGKKYAVFIADGSAKEL